MHIADVSDRSIGELISLVGRVAVVTGAARGTGTAIAHRLAEAGATVVIGDGDAKGAEAAALALRAAGRKALGLQLDVGDDNSVRAFAERVVLEFGAIDIWVNNAGIYPARPLLETTAEAWDEVLDHNLKGTFLGAREAARAMIAAETGGVIVNLASTASFRAARPGLAPYVSSKFGVRGLTQSLAIELGPHRIRVLGVAPTFIITPGTRARRTDLTDEEFEAFLADTGAEKPLRRVGVPDDVARVVLFCASDLSALMTGSTLAVDAGDLAR